MLENLKTLKYRISVYIITAYVDLLEAMLYFCSKTRNHEFKLYPPKLSKYACNKHLVYSEVLTAFLA